MASKSGDNLKSITKAAFLLQLCLLYSMGCGESTGNAGPNIKFSDLSITQLIVGYSHACVNTNLGTYCWGSNVANEIGDNSFSSQSRPVEMVVLDDFTTLTAGTNFTCAIVSSGVKCWGANQQMVLGNSNVEHNYSTLCLPRNECYSLTPVTVEDIGGGGALTNVSSISAGYNHVCVIDTDGAAQCWGKNIDGSLGNGTAIYSVVPVQVSGLTSGVTKIVVGEGNNTCAIVNGGAKCWGSNSLGQVGDTTIVSPRTSPTDVSGFTTGVVDITAGSNHACLIDSDGAVHCWGYGVLGQLGDGNSNTSSTAVATSITSGATALAAGADFTCAIVNGGVKCWGLNSSGQLGAGTGATSIIENSPLDVVGLSVGVSHLEARGSRACAVKDNKVYCWGNGANGQLGNGQNFNSEVPIEVSTPIPSFLNN